ncbi:receptor-recognizing protein [Enterobacter hormaechei]
MAISNPPTGGSIVSETGKRWLREAAPVVQLHGAPLWMHEFAGRSKEIPYEIKQNYYYNSDDLITFLRSKGTTPVVITVSGDIVSHLSTKPTLNFPSNLQNAYIRIINNATIYGRGGNGAGENTVPSNRSPGLPGGDAIFNGIGGRLQIVNNGAIAGGGGGGGQKSIGTTSPGNATYQGGGGGRPFGLGGRARTEGKGGYHHGTDASLGAAGSGKCSGNICSGNGGQVGQKGGDAYGGDTREGHGSAGGAAGYAVRGGGAVRSGSGAYYGVVN